MKGIENYIKGTRIWLPDKEQVWTGGVLTSDATEHELEIELEDGREFVLDLKGTGGELPPLRNPQILVGVNDLTSLSYLHEPAVLYNLHERFVNSQVIYTYCGIVLVALNPYQNVPLYGPDIIATYSGQSMGDMDPHIFAVAEDAFRNMVDMGKNQSIIVSGESGAGKTVSAKYTMRYFANVGGSLNETTIEQKVLASNPIMEAIGNAKTIRNDNSSRFGKYIEINFDTRFTICGASMRTYLLEKSRVVYQAQRERNYHIFYQLCSCKDLPEFQELNLKHVDEFFYTQQGESPTVEGVDDARCFTETCEALELLGVYSEQQRMIWRILAAVLHLGNIDIVAMTKNKDQCAIKPNDFHVRMVGSLLGIDCSQLCKWLCARKIVATGDVYVKPLTWFEANNGRDALAKHIYSQLFNWIVTHVNASLSSLTTDRKSFIGVLDIYGFETFEVNSFEQFCINYANEKLQQQFNQHVFKLEQEEYIREQIQWSFIDFYDNQPCLDLIETKLGILDLLDEECRMPKGSDASWANKLYKQHLKKAQHFEKPRMSDTAFIVRHYADDVIYDCNGFVEKNRDNINAEHLSLLKASQYELVGELFKDTENQNETTARKRTTSRVGKSAPKGKKTVGSQFRDSLSKLMEALNTTAPHYVRCIKSNDNKQPFTLNMSRCVQQLRACGVLETIRISASGYPSRWTYEEFFDRYRMLIAAKDINWDSLHATCQIILNSLIKDEDKFQCGKTKIFFRAGQVAYLERLRSDVLCRSCVKIQKTVRAWVVRKKYVRMKRAAVQIQAWVRGRQATRLVQHLRETRASITIQKRWRGFAARSCYLTVRTQIIELQAHMRGVIQRRRVRAYIQNKRSVVIQKTWRGYRARKYYAMVRKSIILLQCCVRRMAARKELKKLKVEARSVEHLKTVTKGMEIKLMTLQQKLTEEKKEKQAIAVKVKELLVMEEEARSLREIKKVKENLERSSAALQNSNDKLNEELKEARKSSTELVKQREEKDALKNKEIEDLKKIVEELRKSLEEERSRNEKQQIENKELIEKALLEQKQSLEDEFTQERASHQKMIGEYARLEQRFVNLQEEQAISNSPDKRRRTSSLKLGTDGFEEIVVPDILGSEDADEKLQNLLSELSETSRERDMLLEQVVLLKEEQSYSKNVPQEHQAESHPSNEEKLREENIQLKEQLSILTQNIEDKSTDKTMLNHAKLLKQNKESREENAELKKQLDKLLLNQDTLSYSSNNNVTDLAQKEISRLTVENLELRGDIEKLQKQLKEALNAQSQSRNVMSRMDRSMRSKSSASELGRFRSSTTSIESRMADGNISEAGKLLMTYAGLTRKKGESVGMSPSSSTNSMVKRKQGMLSITTDTQEMLVRRLVLELHPEVVEKEVAGYPAHLLFMAVRYIDHHNEERLMQSFLTAVVSNIKRKVLKNPNDIEIQAFWLSNTFRLCCDMRQYSGESNFKSVNSREQNRQCLKNFDLSEYRQVLSDTCVKIYQDMINAIQKKIVHLIVPGMLEYESIPGVESTVKKFKSQRNDSENIITVKDITNKLSAILTVLNVHCVDPSLIKQIFAQIYYYVNGTMVNNLMLRKEMCHWSRGLQIRFNVTQLEEWLRTNQIHEEELIKQLQPITQIAHILQIGKKSLDDVENILEVAQNLNYLQVQKILTMYSPLNEFEPRVPSNLIKAVVSKMKRTDNARIMVDLKYITPMTVAFVPSAVIFDKLEIGAKLELEPVEVV